jgi:hypothetical protein
MMTQQAQVNASAAGANALPPVVVGQRLDSGVTYLLELAADPAIATDTIATALHLLGFTNILPDTSMVAGASVRTFVALATRAIYVTDSPAIAWSSIDIVTIDLFAELSEAARLEPHELTPGTTYEVRFLSRMRSETASKRSAVVASLERIGFVVAKLTSLKRDMRMPGRPNASDELWYARLAWPEERARAVLTIDDPFFFYDVRSLANSTPDDDATPAHFGAPDDPPLTPTELATEEAEAIAWIEDGGLERIREQE